MRVFASNPARLLSRPSRWMVVILLAGLVACNETPSPPSVPATPPEAMAEVAVPGNSLLYAVAWKQTAAEFRALYHQGFNMARAQVAAALANRDQNAKPLAVITDLDATTLLTLDYWGYLVSQNLEFFDDSLWDQWVPDNTVLASPGALEFLRFCAENGVEVFYVSNRDQGEETERYALAQLERLDFPFRDSAHVTVNRESSDKQVVQERIMEDYEVVVLLGDNLNDFSRRYYVTDVEQREALMSEDSALFGSRYILFPNPTDGHWIRAIFGDSEPPDTPENRAILRQAAMRSVWNPSTP